MGKLEFCQNFVFLDGQRISFDRRPYLRTIYRANGDVVIRASRQVEKSTFLCNTIIYEVCRDPNAKVLVVSPRIDQARSLSSNRLLPRLQESPLIRALLLGRGSKIGVENMRFSNGATVTIKAAYRSAGACRGESATMLIVDEFQDISPGELPVLQETLSHAANGRTILTGTPKTIDNHLEGIFNLSTANQWTLLCSHCGGEAVLDDRCLGPVGVACPTCRGPMDPSLGRWVARNPNATWGDGFWISHLMVPWLKYDGILERQRTYDPVRFRNEALGMPTALGDHVVTLQELEACCTGQPMARDLSMIPNAHIAPLIAGVDWGGGVHSRTVVVIGRMRSDLIFEICFIQAFHPHEDPSRIVKEVAAICNRFGVAGVAADGGGNGHVFNLLLNPLIHCKFGIYAISYSTADQPPYPHNGLTKWTVGRTVTIATLFGRIKQKELMFPRKEDVGGFLDEFACEIAEYDDEMHRIKYTHPESQRDDALHATNYGLLLAGRIVRGAQQFG